MKPSAVWDIKRIPVERESRMKKRIYRNMCLVTLVAILFSAILTSFLYYQNLEKQMRQEFCSNASHELKTPITSIQGYAELMESGMIQDENMKMDFIKRIKREAINMAGLINDILMISRLEAKDAEVVVSDVSICLCFSFS